MIEECAGHLAQRREIVNGFVKSSGLAFYQRDRESMARFPPHYGLEGRKSTGSKEPEEVADEAKLRHSVVKGLWFPILNNLTNLIMERRREVQEKSTALFFKVLNRFSQDFTLDFWREILSQIVLPLLEDIHLAVEIPNKK